MVPEYHLASQASTLGTVLLKGDDSEIIGYADEILLFLNHLQEFIQKNPQSKIALSLVNDIIYRFESEPEAALRDRNVLDRLLHLLVNVAQQF